MQWEKWDRNDFVLRVGTVTTVVPAGGVPHTVGRAQTSRPVESYLVEVPGKTPLAQKNIHWPKADALVAAKNKVPGRYVIRLSQKVA